MTSFLVVVGVIAVICLIGYLVQGDGEANRYTEEDAQAAGRDLGRIPLQLLRTTPLQEAEAQLADESHLEREWVQAKRRLFEATCSGNAEATRIQLFAIRAKEILIFRKYESLFQLDAAKDYAQQYCGRIVGSNTWKLPDDPKVSPNPVPPNAGLVLAFASYTELNFSEELKVEFNAKAAALLVDSAIVKENPFAVFLKGLMLKYGLDPAMRPFPRQSKPWLELALELGVDEAEKELASLELHFELEDLRDGYSDKIRFVWT